MQTDSDHSSNKVSPSRNPKSQTFLIPRSQRRNFFIKFTFMTILGWIVGGIASITLEKTILEALPPVVGKPITWYSCQRYLSSGLFAVVFGADQAFVTHRYMSGWLWMLATSVGWMIANSVSAAWINYISSIASSLNKTLSPHELFILGILSTCAYIISGIWLGFCQWLVLRRYTVGSWWWNFLPSISFLFISISIGLLSLLQEFIPQPTSVQILNFSGQGLTAVILGVIPAIGLCLLKTNSGQPD